MQVSWAESEVNWAESEVSWAESEVSWAESVPAFWKQAAFTLGDYKSEISIFYPHVWF